MSVPSSIPLGRAGRLRRIFGLALPIVGGMASQNVLNLVDTAMVGTLGAAALAAVGSASFVNFMCVAGITGLSSAVQATVARRIGEGKVGESAEALDGGLAVALLVGAPLSVLLIALAPYFYPLVNDDPAVVAEAVPYLQARLCAMVAVGMNFAFRGFWNGIDRSRVYMNTLLFMHISNIAISWCLIFGRFGLPELGAPGAGVGTAIATWLGTLMYVWLAWKHARGHGFLSRMPTAETLGRLLRLALPSSIQQITFAAGYTLLFTIVGLVGTTETAAASVLINVSFVAILPGLGLGLAAASLVGQALGRGDADDARQWGWDVVTVASLAMAVLGTPMWLAPDLVLAPFLHDAATLEVARAPLRLVGIAMALDGVGMVLLNALMGAGATSTAARVSIGMQWGLFLPIAWIVGPVLGGGLWAIWVAMVAYRAVQALLFAVIWQRGGWATARV